MAHILFDRIRPNSLPGPCGAAAPQVRQPRENRTETAQPFGFSGPRPLGAPGSACFG